MSTEPTSSGQIGAATSTGGEKVFLRQSTGLVRLMGTTDALIYNTMITTIVLGAALTYLWVPYAFPGANIPLGLLITGVLGATMMGAYSLLATAMPRSGGDYVFQSRLVHPVVGFVLVMTGFVVFLAFWMNLSGWLLAVIAISPFSATLGTATGATWLVNFGIWAASPGGITTISLIGFAITLAVLIVGIRLYMRIQWVLWILVSVTFLLTWILLISHTQADFINAFNAYMTSQGAKPDFYHGIITAAQQQGYATASFSLSDTFGVAPIAWTALAWTMWSVVSAGELKHARRLNGMLIQTIGALAINTVALVITALLLINTMGWPFLSSLGFLYFSGSTTLSALPAPPFFGILASILASNPFLIVLLGLGFVATAIQNMIGMAWGGSRIIMSMAFDRLLPAPLADLNNRYHTPVKALLALYGLSAAFVVLYNFTIVSKYTLAVTLTAILTYSGTMVAAIVFPYRAKEIYNASPAARYKVLGLPLVSVLGAIGLVFNLVMVWYFLTVNALFVNSPQSIAMIVGVLAVLTVFFFVRRSWLKRQGFEPDITFSLIPPE